jgi:hypothetical protein
MSLFAVEQSRDENTGLECWLVINTTTGVVMDRAFDYQDALEIADYYYDQDDQYEDDGQPSEFDEWMDFDSDC